MKHIVPNIKRNNSGPGDSRMSIKGIARLVKNATDNTRPNDTYLTVGGIESS